MLLLIAISPFSYGQKIKAVKELTGWSLQTTPKVKLGSEVKINFASIKSPMSHLSSVLWGFIERVFEKKSEAENIDGILSGSFEFYVKYLSNAIKVKEKYGDFAQPLENN